MYLLFRFTLTFCVCGVNLLEVYLIAMLSGYKALWLLMTLASFTCVLLELCVYYRANVQAPDDNGMVTRVPTKSESFVRSIPIAQKEQGDAKPLIETTEDGQDYDIDKFKGQKVLYIMLIYDKQESRPSCVMEK